AAESAGDARGDLRRPGRRNRHDSRDHRPHAPVDAGVEEECDTTTKLCAARNAIEVLSTADPAEGEQTRSRNVTPEECVVRRGVQTAGADALAVHVAPGLQVSLAAEVDARRSLQPPDQTVTVVWSHGWRAASVKTFGIAASSTSVWCS